MKHSIEISKELYDKLEAKAKFGETPNDVIVRLIGLASNKMEVNTHQVARKRNVKLLSKGVEFWEGMRLRAIFKGREYLANVSEGEIVYSKVGYNSPSAAAMAITNGPVNGWKFWDYLDESTNKWRSIDDLRKL